jgi:hypothetical protein
MILKKAFLILLLACLQTFAFGQVDKSYSKNFEAGTITKPDGTVLTGLLSFFPSQAGKLKFKATEQAEVIKYEPGEVKSFQIGNDLFESLDSLSAYGQAGIKVRLKNSFGQLLERDKISVYLIYFVAPSFGGQNIHYLNFWLVKTVDNNSTGLAVPYNQRLKAGKIEKIKAELKIFLNDSRLNERVDNLARESGLAETVEIVKEYNAMMD